MIKIKNELDIVDMKSINFSGVIINGKKACTKCYLVKNINEFNKRPYIGSEVYMSWCKSCASKYNIEYLKTKCVSIPNFKICNTCGLNKSKEEYYVHKSNGLMHECKKCISDKGKIIRDNDKDKQRKLNRKNARQVKVDCLYAYGTECACCGEGNIEFLSIDHMDKDIRDQEHLNMKGSGTRFYYWLRKKGFPTDIRLRTLCMNCNISYGHYGYCPHKENREWL